MQSPPIPIPKVACRAGEKLTDHEFPRTMNLATSQFTCGDGLLTRQWSNKAPLSNSKNTAKIVKVSGIQRVTWSDFSQVPSISAKKTETEHDMKFTEVIPEVSLNGNVLDESTQKTVSSENAKMCEVNQHEAENTQAAPDVPAEDRLRELTKEIGEIHRAIKRLSNPFTIVANSFIPSCARAKKCELLFLQNKMQGLKAQKRELKASRNKPKFSLPAKLLSYFGLGYKLSVE